MTSRLLTFALLLAVLLVSLCSRAGSANPEIERATAAIEAARARAQADPGHPIFHVTAPAQWINDPNGPIYFKGYYHLFYQLHPFSDESGPKYWGHVRSRDLAKWEPLPIAVWPSKELGEVEIWSGCCAINGRGDPMIFYTSIGSGKSAFDQAEQWAAIGDKDLITWRKSPTNPVLSEALHDGVKIYEWRDPFIFQEKHRTFLVAGGNLNRTKGGEATVNIYEAENPEFTKWKYRGVLFKIPDPKARTAECPNFFKLGSRWVLFVSPYGKVQYFVGDLDLENCRFHAESQGLLDFGPNFYAPNTMQVPDGRRIVWGWVNGFPRGHGWNGCLSIPRELALTKDGQLQQVPAPELRKLRGKEAVWRNVEVSGETKAIELPATNTFEIAIEAELKNSAGLTLEISDNGAGSEGLLIKVDGSKVKMADAEAPVEFAGKERKLKLNVFLDRSVLELFVNDSACVTKTVRPFGAGARLKVSAQGGEARLARVRAWPMQTIW
jgi:beta-fructofuranosidase